MWHDDLQLYLPSDSRDNVSLFDHVSGAAPAPPATDEVSTRSQWLSRYATARLAIQNHLLATECAHFGEHRTAQALYDDVVARYSSPATAAIGRLLLPYLFPELSASATIADLVTHLRTSDARYRATVPAEFLPTNQPPMFITLYFIVTRLPDSLCSVKDHFLTLDPTSLTIDLLEQHLLAAETSAVADVGAASTSTKCPNSKCKGGRGSGGGSGGGGGSGHGSGGSGRGGGSGGGGGGGGTGGGGGSSGGGGGGSGGSGGSGGGVTSGGRSGPQRGGFSGGRGLQQQRRARIRRPSSSGRTCGRFHTEHRCFARLDDAWRTEFGDDVERPRWAELFRSGVAIFDLDFDVIISAMYALSFSAEGDCYWCVPPDPGIAAAALGASASGTPPSTALAEALHTFTLDSGASRCYFRDSTTLTPLPTPVPVRLTDPSRGPIVASSSTVLPCLAVPSGSLSGLHLPSFSRNLVSTTALQDAMVTTTTPGGQRVSICTCTRTGHHLATFLGTHTMALRPSSVPLRVPLPAPPESSLPEVPDPDLLLLLLLLLSYLTFAAACCLDYASALVAESVPASPPSVGGECALGTDVLEDRQKDFECLAAAVPRFASLLLAPEGDPDAPDIPTPRSYAEAIEGPYSSQWQAAMDAEMASWKSTGTYVDEVPPPGVNIVDGMWIFSGVDYFQTFFPTPKMTTLRVLLHVAAQRDYELHSLDFSTAFVQGSVHEEIWLHRPPNFTRSFPTGTQWSLRWPVYGLRQAPREWHDTLRTTLAALGFVPSTANPSLFLRTDTSLPPFYVLVYVDDLIFAMADTEALTLVKSELQKRHTCTDLGELRSYLGLQITRDRARCTITLTQSHMVHQVLQRFGFQYSSPQLTPLSTSHSLSAPPSDESIEPSGPYPELVGCLMYLMTCTRPNLAYPLSLLAHYVAPGRHRKVHWDAAKRVLRYLCSTSGMGLVLGGRGPVVLTGHADASWVEDSATQRLSQGYTFSLGSGSVSWESTRSSSVLNSSCEAEIYAGAMAAQELRWLTYLLTDLGEEPRSPPILYVDNKAMIALCQEHRLEHRTKHIALRYFLARELQQRAQLRLAYVAISGQHCLLCFASSLDWSYEWADSEEKEGQEEQVEQVEKEEQGEQAAKEARVGKEDQEVHGYTTRRRLIATRASVSS
ncbi:unnamed protein product [Closterium sp. NIES-53]